jgi:hypothetical protein
MTDPALPLSGAWRGDFALLGTCGLHAARFLWSGGGGISERRSRQAQSCQARSCRGERTELRGEAI